MIEDILKNKKIKPTVARISLLTIFQERQKPLCYEDIKESISMDKATFYRNMATFEQAGLFNIFSSSNNIRYFELKHTPHAHFICSKCNKVECIKNIDISIEGHEIQTITIGGICKECIGSL